MNNPRFESVHRSRTVRHCLAAAVMLSTLPVMSCRRGGGGGGGGEPAPNPPVVTVPVVTSVSPSENPRGGLGITLRVQGSGFQNGAEVWLDLDRSNARRLTTSVVSSNEVAALASTEELSNPFGNSHVFVRQGGLTSSNFVVLNDYFPCNSGNDTGPYGNFAGSINGNVVLDANLDQLRFRADNMQLVVDGVRLSNTVYVPSTSTVTINGNASARIYSVPGSSGAPVAVIGTIDGSRLRDQTRGAVDSPAEWDCSDWLLRTVPFGLPTPSATAAASLAGHQLSFEWGAQAPCPAIEVARSESGEQRLELVNLVPGRLYHVSMSFAAGFARMPGAMDAEAASMMVAARGPRHSIPLPGSKGAELKVAIVDATDGVNGCGSFARSDLPMLGPTVGVVTTTAAQNAAAPE